jgi:hypothetical protein
MVSPHRARSIAPLAVSAFIADAPKVLASRLGFDAILRAGDCAVDEELDGTALDAGRSKDTVALSTIDPARLNSGASEIGNRIAGAGEHLDTAWQEYIPCYRSAAGTGCGMGFAVWR